MNYLKIGNKLNKLRRLFLLQIKLVTSARGLHLVISWAASVGADGQSSRELARPEVSGARSARPADSRRVECPTAAKGSSGPL